MPVKAYQCNRCLGKFFEELESASSIDKTMMTCPFCGGKDVEDANLDSRDILMMVDVNALFPGSYGIPRG